MKKKLLPALIVTGLIILVVIIMGITALINKYTPTKKTEDLKEYFNISSDDEAALIVDNELSDYKAKIIDKKIYVDYKFVHDSLNSRFYWDANENVLLYTTASDIISAAADSNSYSVTKQTNDFGYPIVKATSDSTLIALDYVKQYSNITFKSYDDPARIVITSKWDEIDSATVNKSTQVRVKGGIKSPILKEVKKDDKITILDSGDKWDKVATEDGVIGYIKSKALSFIVIGLSRASLETTLPIKSHISSSLSSLDKSISESIISLILCPKSSSTRNTPSHVSYDISKLIPLPQLYKLITCRYRCRDDRRLNQLNPLNYIA
jgi:hypothetical protein